MYIGLENSVCVCTLPEFSKHVSIQEIIGTSNSKACNSNISEVALERNCHPEF